jgi:1-acyl-sn-glycerol-3-phosphate acyltransferase
MNKNIRALGRASALAALSMTVVPIQLLIAGPLLRDFDTLPNFFSKMCSKILGLTIEFNGVAKNKDPVIYIANHTSYLDGVTLGSKLKGNFIGKAAIANWPLIGKLGHAVRTIFIERTREDLPRAHVKMIRALNKGENILFFPEGTTTDFNIVGRFNAGLLRVLFKDDVKNIKGEDVKLEKNVTVLPMAIKVKSVNGESVQSKPELKDKYAWYGETSMLSHIWNCLQNKSMTIELKALKEVKPDDFKKSQDPAISLANEAHRQVTHHVIPEQLEWFDPTPRIPIPYDPKQYIRPIKPQWPLSL